MRECRRCGRVKPYDEFCKGRKYRCKQCHTEMVKESNRGVDGVSRRIYNSQIRSSKKRGYTPPTYTLEEFRRWLYSNPLFSILYVDWATSGYITRLKPSVDRKDDYKPYTIDNIQLMTWGDNYDKYQIDKMSGVNNKGNIPVKQYTKNGEFIKEYHSISYASRYTGISHEGIGRVCAGSLKTSGGFIWKYSKKELT